MARLSLLSQRLLLFIRELSVYLLLQSGFPRRCWKAQAQVPLPWIPELCWCPMRLGHRSCLFQRAEWQGCRAPLCCLWSTNPALSIRQCRGAASPGPVPPCCSWLRRVSLASPCSWSKQLTANAALSSHQHLVLCTHGIIGLFLPSLQRKRFYTLGCVLECWKISALQRWGN